MGRKAGQRIRDICEQLEQSGPQGISELRAAFPEVERSNIGKYCSRGIGLGLITAETYAYRRTFTVAHDWREIADRRRTTKEAVQETAHTSKWYGVNSIFSIGAT